MAITAEQQNSRLEGPKPPKGKIVLQAPPELEPSDGVNTLLTSLVPLLGTASAMVMAAAMAAPRRSFGIRAPFFFVI